MYTFEELRSQLLDKTKAKNSEFTRLFHGRGGCFEGFEFLTVDAIDSVLSVAYFDEIDALMEKKLHGLFENSSQQVLMRLSYYKDAICRRPPLKYFLALCLKSFMQ
jgi:hypothetical protein